MPGILQDDIDPLDTLESQIEELERRILGDLDLSEKEPNILESLLQSNSTINNSIANHSSIKTLFDRLDQLEQYLDPSFEDSLVDLAAKKKVVLESENELRDHLLQAKKLSELNKNLDGMSFKNVPILVENLRKISLQTINTQSEFDKLQNEIKTITVNLNTALKSLNSSFLLMETALAEIEGKEKETGLRDLTVD